MAKQPSDVKGHVLFEIFTKAIYTTFTRAIKEAGSTWSARRAAARGRTTLTPVTVLVSQTRGRAAH